MSTHIPSIYADFNNADALGRLRLNCAGTIRDLASQGIVLREGLRLHLHDEELGADAQVCFSETENVWVAIIDWSAIDSSSHQPQSATVPNRQSASGKVNRKQQQRMISLSKNQLELLRRIEWLRASTFYGMKSPRIGKLKRSSNFQLFLSPRKSKKIK